MPRYVCHICKENLPLVNGRPESWRCAECRRVIAQIKAVLGDIGARPATPERESRIKKYCDRANRKEPLFD